MPNTTCFSYPGSASPHEANRGAARAARSDLRKMPYPCYRYPNVCFSYPDGMPRGGGSPAAGQAPPPGPRRMPFGTCFRY